MKDFKKGADIHILILLYRIYENATSGQFFNRLHIRVIFLFYFNV